MSQSTTNISLVAAFSAGLLSFVSPCVLPLIPSYISYITGLSIEQLTDSTLRSKFKKTIVVNGRGPTAETDYRAGPRVWPLRVSADHRPVTARGVAGES